jgi:tRNA-2-methylthio-N6-dimethylallyladenosine synthase
MNHSDAERIETVFQKNKLRPTASIDEADLIVLVTCGVRQSAEDRVYGRINNIHKEYPKKKIILTGCLAHRKDVQRRLKNKVDLFATINNFPKAIVSCIKYHVLGIKKEKIYNTLYKVLNTKIKPCNDYLNIIPKYTSPYIAYIPIMTGCNNFCTYCVVPYARGQEYSRPAEDILKEVKILVKKGYKEIILLGQNVNSYKGLCKNKEINFPKLLRLIENIPAKRSAAPHQTAEGGFGVRGNFWITFLTSHPKDMSEELIKTIAKSKKICEYISLPAQSGDNEILSKMNRHYTVSHYRNLIKKIRADFKRYKPVISPSISTDIIVGFPGETKRQFESTAKLLREMKFDMAYISQYSPRPETAAWKLEDNVSKKEKERRDKILTKIIAKTALANNKKYVGKIVEVLVDANGKGHTRTQKKVIFSSNKKIPIGNFAKVKITKVKAFGLEGEEK